MRSSAWLTLAVGPRLVTYAMAQRPGALSNLDGTVEFFSVDPAEAFGVGFEQVIGSDSARRTFVKLETGEFGSGMRPSRCSG